jgi:hypothetical protein
VDFWELDENTLGIEKKEKSKPLVSKIHQFHTFKIPKIPQIFEIKMKKIGCEKIFTLL